MNAFIEGFVEAMRIGCATAAVATSCVMLIAVAMALRDGAILAGVIFGSGSLWLLSYSSRRWWALMFGRPEDQAHG